MLVKRDLYRLFLYPIYLVCDEVDSYALKDVCHHPCIVQFCHVEGYPDTLIIMDGQTLPSPPYVEPLSPLCIELPGVEPPSPVISERRHEPCVNTVSFSDDSERQVSAGTVIVKIEEILERIRDALRETQELSIPMRIRPSGNEVCVRFPSSNLAEVKRFSVLRPHRS